MKKAVILLICLLLVVSFSGAGASAATASFIDVPPTHPYYDDIIWATQLGLVSGYQDGSFHPDAPIKKGEYGMIVYRLWGKDWLTKDRYNDYAMETCADIKPGHWAYMGMAFEARMSSGMFNKTTSDLVYWNFSPNEYLKRWQFAGRMGDFIGRSIGWDKWPKGSTGMLKLSSDVRRTAETGSLISTVEYYIDGLDYLSELYIPGTRPDQMFRGREREVRMVIFQGVECLLQSGAVVLENNKFEPNRIITRAEILHMLRNFHAELEKGGAITELKRDFGGK